MEPLYPATWRYLYSPELARRQFGRNFGPPAKLPTATLWGLRRPHCRHSRRFLFDGRARAVGIRPSGDRARDAHRFPDALDRGLPRHLHPRPVPTLVLEVWAN